MKKVLERESRETTKGKSILKRPYKTLRVRIRDMESTSWYTKFRRMEKNTPIWLIRFLYYYFREMWLLKKISCEIQILNEKVWKLMIENGKLEEKNKKLKEEVEQLKNQRIFNSAEYDLITLTSTTPQWELRRK